MAKAIKLSDELVAIATIQSKAECRTPPKQIEYWVKIGRLAEENPDLPFDFIKGILIGIEEAKEGDLSDYQFG